MSKTVGGIDERGHFLLRVTFDTRNPEDMDQMMKTLRDSEAHASVEYYDEDNVTVTIRPGL